MAKKYKPFKTSRHHQEWVTRNCGTCYMGYVRVRNEFRCDWERELEVALLTDGQLSKETARAIGFFDSSPIIEGCDIWECPGWARG